MRVYALQLPAVGMFSNASDGNSFRRTSAIDSCFDVRNLSPIGVPRSRADVRHAETAEPKRVHGQRPWFQSLMMKDEG